ncbi:MAG: methionine biosynthesis protein MetW [Patescibacteria group bacterium]
MFYFKGTRKPDFKNIKKVIDYDQYWRVRGFKIRDKLMAREKICFDWIKPDSSVLDVGCGNSRFLYELKKNKNCQVYGLDVSGLVIDSLAQEGIAGRVIDITKTDFDFIKEKEFDYIILNEVLEHVINPEEIIGKLKGKGRFFILSVPNTGFYRYRIGLMFFGRFPTQWAMHPSEHVRFWTHKDFLDWISDLGLETISCKTTDGFQFFGNSWKNMFGHLISYLVKEKK